MALPSPLPASPDASTPVREPGRNGGGSLALTGTDYIAVPDAPALDIVGSLTVEAWIRPDAFRTDWVPIINKDSDGRHGSFAMFLHANGTLWLGGTRANGSNYSMQTGASAVTFGDLDACRRRIRPPGRARCGFTSTASKSR